MKIKHVVLLLCAAFFIFCTPPFSKSSAGTVSPDEAGRVLNEIFSRYIDIYHKYRGVESVRNEIIREYETGTDKLLSVSEITVMRTDYFYERPLAEVRAYKKNGKAMEPSTLHYQKDMPSFPVFDERGRENYDIRITEKKLFKGRECYEVQVAPRKETARHFKGVLYYTVEKLDLVYLEGTVARLDFPVKSFKMEFNTIMYKGIPVTSDGRIFCRIKAPIIYPDTMIVSQITVLENKLIPL